LRERATRLRHNSKPLRERVNWQPQKRQKDFLDACGFGGVLDGGPVVDAIAPLIGYGGAAGGGKTDANLGLCLYAMLSVPGISICYFRRKFTELEGSKGAIERSREIFRCVKGARYNESKHVWRFPNGSKLHFCHCAHAKNRFDYQSTAIDILIIDEATHFTWEIVDYLLTRNRSSIDDQDGTLRVKPIKPFAVFCTNPGNVGHFWYKSLFIDSGDGDRVNEAQTPNGELEQVFFLFATLEDNAILRKRDPDYERKLESRDEDTKRMLRYGDWDVAGGLFFGRIWRSVPRDGKAPHIVKPFVIPVWWKLFGSVDYGFNARTPTEKPFVYGLYAAGDDGHIYRINEIAAAHLNAREQIAKIKELEAQYDNKVQYRQGCPSMFIRKEEGAPTIAEEYAVNDVPVRPSITDRINGWERCRLMLSDAPDGRPWFQSFANCRHFNTIIPSLPCDENNIEDIDDAAEDHAAEEWRHFLMSRPAPSVIPKPVPQPNSPAADELEDQYAEYLD
jgi:hypothetical protein